MYRVIISEYEDISLEGKSLLDASVWIELEKMRSDYSHLIIKQKGH